MSNRLMIPRKGLAPSNLLPMYDKTSQRPPESDPACTRTIKSPICETFVVRRGVDGRKIDADVLRTTSIVVIALEIGFSPPENLSRYDTSTTLSWDSQMPDAKSSVLSRQRDS